MGDVIHGDGLSSRARTIYNVILVLLLGVAVMLVVDIIVVPSVINDHNRQWSTFLDDSIYVYNKDGSEVIGHNYSMSAISFALRTSFRSSRYRITSESTCEIVYSRGGLLELFSEHCTPRAVPPDIQALLLEARKKLAEERRRAQEYVEALSPKK